MEHQVGAFFNATLISLEHRYYGKSQPMPDLSSENLAYLTSQQSLEDIKSFLLWYHEHHPFKKVVLVGCSYAGALVGWFAENESQYMNSFKQEPLPFEVAAWSSSGVLRPLESFWGFDETIYQ